MPSTKGVAGSRMGQACTTNSCSLLLAFSLRNRKRLSSGLLADGLELLELIVGELTVLKSVIVYLVN